MSIKLKIEGEIFEVDPRYAEVSGLIEVLVKQSAGEEVIFNFKTYNRPLNYQVK